MPQAATKRNAPARVDRRKEFEVIRHMLDEIERSEEIVEIAKLSGDEELACRAELALRSMQLGLSTKMRKLFFGGGDAH